METMVGFGKDLIQMKDRLTGQQSQLHVIPIVGMGGIGKTTLAMNLYNDPLIVQHFDARAWFTVSQEYSLREILLSLLRDIEGIIDQTQQESSERIAECIYKSLKGRRYLIVMDDIWSTKLWDDVRRFFPDDHNGSRIMLTTRLLNVAGYVDSYSTHHQMGFLNEDKSWTLFNQIVFAKESCPQELQEVGRIIANSCQGLPLAILVIGGLMLKAKRTVEYWESILGNVSSVTARNDEQFSEVLSLSYNNLPPHLKPCFLYMGVFPEDSEIRASRLIKLWVAEGFLKPVGDRSLEEVAEEYLHGHIDRNLISIRQRRSMGKIKTCIIHDLLRDICVKEAHKEKFFRVINRYLHTFMYNTNVSPRRLVAHQNIGELGGDDDDDDDDAIEGYAVLKCLPSVRSFVWLGHYRHLSSFQFGFKLLKVLHVIDSVFDEFPVQILELIHLRYLALTCYGALPHEISALQNLQIVIFFQRWLDLTTLPSAIWMMPQLRHVQMNELRFPIPNDWRNTHVLENLQTISFIRDLEYTVEFFERIPNLKKLGISYGSSSTSSMVHVALHNLYRLEKLETLKCNFTSWHRHSLLLKDMVFPHTLKKLTLSGGLCIPWEYMTVIGELPSLEVLKLRIDVFDGKEWVPVEGQFCQLRFLLIESSGLEQWQGDETHFPVLEKLILRKCRKIEGIPSGIYIPTLELIDMQSCSASCVLSANSILEDQRSMGNFDLQVLVSQ